MSLPSSPPVSDFATDPAASRPPPLPDPATGVPPLPDLSPDAPSGAPATQPVSPDTPLTLRQEAFCRHFAATGNAAGAARAAGYAEGSARQTGHELLERPAVAARVRDIRQAWRAVERAEAQILLGRLEQAWDAAVEKGSASLMLRVVKLQAELSGLDRRSAGRRAGLWPLPEEDAFPHPTDADAAESGTTAGPPAGPLAEAVRRGRHRTERALAFHRASRKALEQRPEFDEADWLATAHRLHGTVEERRPPLHRPGPAEDRSPDAPILTDPDISLHGSLRPSIDGAEQPESPESAADDDIALRRAGLLPAETAGGPAFDAQAWCDDPHAEMARIDAEGRNFTDEELGAFRANVARATAASRRENRDKGPDERWSKEMLNAGNILQPAGDPCPTERRAAEEEQAYLKDLARTRPPLENRTAGAYLAEFDYVRPCRGA